MHLAPRGARSEQLDRHPIEVAFVRAGFGWSIISEIVAREDAAAGRIDLVRLAPPLSRDLFLVWRADRAARPVISAALAVFAAHVGLEGAGLEGAGRAT